ncbi:hypothetical protein RJ639_000771 [Escallonia herrerae]|uniref:PB1 domain-containing protein n=1 Tax=Escallonia herrerae TaxID=1293975 RepID=A0AA88XHA9_9ASTE|nr:hypothetical protein RJ639_000771 [Escallonia herrerae]
MSEADEENLVLLSNLELVGYMNRKYFCIAPSPASSPTEERYLKPLFVYWNQDTDPQPPLSPSSLRLEHVKIIRKSAASSVPESRVIQEKIKTALTLLTFRDQRILLGGRCFLTTSDHPFGLGQVDGGLYMYRMDSIRNKWVVNGDNEGEEIGPPGRVFCSQLPEWTSDVRHYSIEDYSRCFDAVRRNIRGSLALPVFEPSHQSCVGVLELVMSTEYLDYEYEVEEVSRALKVLAPPPVLFKFFHLSYIIGYVIVANRSDSSIILRMNAMSGEWSQHAMDKIFKALRVVCDIYTLPLAQTWVVSGFCCVVTYDVSRSMLKLICRQHNISRWPPRKRLKKQTNESPQGTNEHSMGGDLDRWQVLNCTRDGGALDDLGSSPLTASSTPISLSSSSPFALNASGSSASGFPDLPMEDTTPIDGSTIQSIWGGDLLCCDPFHNPDIPNVAETMPPVRRMQGGSNVTIKVNYDDNKVKFKFSLPSTMVELEEQGAKRLQLKVGKFCLKYLDEDGDWIQCNNADFWDFLDGVTTIRLLVINSLEKDL